MFNADAFEGGEMGLPRSGALGRVHVVMESVSHSEDGIIFGLPGSIRYLIEAKKTVRQAILATYNSFSPRSLKESAIELTFVPQGIIFRCDNYGRRKTTKTLSQQRRGQWICDVLTVTEIVAAEPDHIVSSEEWTMRILLIGRRRHTKIRNGIHKKLE
jgi:hypothetical protein